MNQTKPQLIDPYNRTLNYMRVSITDRCNLQCIYCTPRHGIPKMDHKDILRYEEILRLINLAVNLGIDKVRLTGNKRDGDIFYWHTGYPGGIKSETARERLEKKPERIIRDAVWGMLPKNRLGRAMFKKLKVYKGSDHPHKAQKPEVMQ